MSGKGEDNIHQLPERDTGDGLTARQRKVLEVIRNAVASRGYPPSLREIGELVGLTSPSSVAHQLSSLERKGYLRRDPNRPRAIEVISPDDSTPAVAAEVTDLTEGMRGGASTHDEVVDPTGSGDEHPEASYVPVLGQIAAGVPITAEEVVDDVVEGAARRGEHRVQILERAPHLGLEFRLARAVVAASDLPGDEQHAVGADGGRVAVLLVQCLPAGRKDHVTLGHRSPP